MQLKQLKQYYRDRNFNIYNYLPRKKYTVNPVLSGPLKNRQNKDFNVKWQLNEGRKYCRMLQLTCIK